MKNLKQQLNQRLDKLNHLINNPTIPSVGEQNSIVSEPPKPINYENVNAFIKAVRFLDPRAVVIERYRPSDRTKAGVYKPGIYHDREVRSTMWGKILLVPEVDPEDYLSQAFRANVKVGDWVSFLPNNTINGGLPTESAIQLTAYTDIKLVLTEEDFNKFIRDSE